MEDEIKNILPVLFLQVTEFRRQFSTPETDIRKYSIVYTVRRKYTHVPEISDYLRNMLSP